MSVRLWRENECGEPGCHKPAHIGELCASCFMAATPARRAVELDCHQVRDARTRRRTSHVRQLEALFELPAYAPTEMLP